MDELKAEAKEEATEPPGKAWEMDWAWDSAVVMHCGQSETGWRQSGGVVRQSVMPHSPNSERTLKFRA